MINFLRFDEICDFLEFPTKPLRELAVKVRAVRKKTIASIRRGNRKQMICLSQGSRERGNDNRGIIKPENMQAILSGEIPELKRFLDGIDINLCEGVVAKDGYRELLVAVIWSAIIALTSPIHISKRKGHKMIV